MTIKLSQLAKHCRAQKKEFVKTLLRFNFKSEKVQRLISKSALIQKAGKHVMKMGTVVQVETSQGNKPAIILAFKNFAKGKGNCLSDYREGNGLVFVGDESGTYFSVTPKDIVETKEHWENERKRVISLPQDV